MTINRRLWLKQIGLAAAGIGLTQFKTLASPASDPSIFVPQDDTPICLRFNENPYGPSPLARTAMAENIKISNRYQWELTKTLISDIAKKNTVTSDHVILGAGSTDILSLAVQYTALQKGSFIIADPSFGSWTKMAEGLGLKKISVPLAADKRCDLTAMLAAVQADTRLVYVCNPNNPTGTVCDTETLASFIREATKTAIVLLDEAYIDYTSQPSMSNMVTVNKNLIVVKTFSKIYGLASARVGYAIAHADTVNALSAMQTWANGGVGVVSVSGAIASLKDTDFVKECYTLNEKARQYTIEQLERLQITCIPSHTNFIYFSLANYKKDFFAQLENNHITGTGVYEENGKWTRITVGTMQEMQKFISSIA